MMMISLLSLIQDTWYTFFTPLICFISLLTNLVNALVLSKLTQKNKIYIYLYFKTIINSIYLFLLVFVFLIKCGRYCSFKETYIANLYHLYIFSYIASVLALIELILHVVISINRWLEINKKDYFSTINTNKTLLITSIISFLYFFPYLFVFKITELEDYQDSTSYIYKSNNDTDSVGYHLILDKNFRQLDEFIDGTSFLSRVFLKFFLISINISNFRMVKTCMKNKYTQVAASQSNFLHNINAY